MTSHHVAELCHASFSLGHRLDAWQLNVEQLLSNMEVAKQQGQLFAALKSGNEAVAQMQKDVTIADVEALMQTSAEANVKQQEMQARTWARMTLSRLHACSSPLHLPCLDECHE